MFSMMYYKRSRGVGCYPVDHIVTIMKVKLLSTIHRQNVRLETDVVIVSHILVN